MGLEKIHQPIILGEVKIQNHFLWRNHMFRYFKNLQGRVVKLTNCSELDSETIIGFHVGKPGSVIFNKGFEVSEDEYKQTIPHES